MSLLKEGKTNWKYILISFILAILVGIGILHYSQLVEREISSLIPLVLIEPEEYAVYSTLIKQRFIGERTELIVIREDTSISPILPGEMIQGAVTYFGETLEVEEEILKDFGRRNTQTYPLDRHFDLGIDYLLISDEEITHIFQSREDVEECWNEFYERYPHSQGIMILSRVGFNLERNKAVVYIGNQSGWLMGAGYGIFLVKKDNSWVIEDEVMLWIS